MKKLAAALFVLINFGALSMTASATDVQLQLLNNFGGPVGGVYTYPYTFNITSTTGTMSNVPLMCIDFTRETALNQNWKATPETLAGAAAAEASPTLAQLDEDAYLLSEILAIAATDPNYGTSADVEALQFAAWRVLAPTADSGNAGINAAAAADLLAAAANAPGEPSSFYNGFTLFVPDPDTGSPQRFLGYFPPGTNNFTPPVPEPSSLMLLGTGVLGAAGMLRRRLVKA